MKMQPILILMRHAARDFADDLLSSEGHRQASTLLKTLQSMALPLPSRVQSSPKNRTQSTLRFLQEELHTTAVIDPRLDERQANEHPEEFSSRIEAYLDACMVWAQNETRDARDSVWLACSHLDWLEEAVLQLPSDENDFERSEPWSPMAIRAYSFENGIWHRLKR